MSNENLEQHQGGEFAALAGCIPASSAEALIARWTMHMNQWLDDEDGHRRQNRPEEEKRCHARVSIYEVCIKDLRAEMGRSSKRQPEYNGDSAARQP